VQQLSKDPDKMTLAEKEAFTAHVFKCFVDGLDGANDIYKQILLDTVFEFLYSNEEESDERLHLPDQSGQTITEDITPLSS
jgi:hypothetical protein